VLTWTSGAAHLGFLQWWDRWLANRTDASRGVICPTVGSRDADFACLGGGMATHGIELGEPRRALST